jgi:hypothetical protein
MKKILLAFFVATITLTSGFSQSYSDDFESYDENAFIALSSPNWVTWSNTPGSAEDVRVSTERAASGEKSLKLISLSTNGGPQDIVLPFGQKYTSGFFSFDMNMFVEPDRGAYFNFQGEVGIGVSWALEATFNIDGLMTLRSSGATYLTAEYPVGEWFNVRFDINLDQNSWKYSLNGDCVGVFENRINAIASLNLYPVHARGSIFFVDDVNYEYSPTAPEILRDLAVSALSWDKGRLAGSSTKMSYTISNKGINPIQSVELSFEHNGNVTPILFGNLDLQPGESLVLYTDEEIVLEPGLNEMFLTVVQVDGENEDEEACNDRAQLLLNAVAPAPHKAVLVEEGTGTWCVWCPRGTVWMDRLNTWYPGRFIPVAVHNRDPMEVFEYDALLTSTPGFPGFPAVVINRQIVADPGVMETPFLNEITVEPIASIVPGADWNEENRELQISGMFEMLTDVEGEYWATAVITEDEVRGTGQGWSQANAYAGGGNGPMGGYEALPNPVPAQFMKYDHVARAIMGISKAPANSFSGSMAAGDRQILNFSTVVPEVVNMENVLVIVILFGPQGYENAIMVPLEEALENGFSVGTSGFTYDNKSHKVFPNPANHASSVELNLENATEVAISIIDLQGRTLASRNYGTIQGDLVFPVETHMLPSGMYMLQIRVGNDISIQKLQVIR